jgi:hypothetical protein
MLSCTEGLNAFQRFVWNGAWTFFHQTAEEARGERW